MNSIPVYFGPEMVADTKSYSPSAGKPALVVADWQAQGLPISVIAPPPVSREEFNLAHEAEHVDDILSGQAHNGFGNFDPQVAATLPYTTGAMLSAALYAVINRSVACAPVSGFHHAGWDFTGGFCTFNGLMVTLHKLRATGFIERAAILDLDMHYGNGTQNIIEVTGAQSWVQHFSDAFFPDRAEAFLQNLRDLVAKLTYGADILLYQAGADSHIDDPLGGYLTSDQMRRRDRIVFETCKELGVPVAWNLAGGYQRDAAGGIEPVLALHRATMEECAATFIRR